MKHSCCGQAGISILHKDILFVCLSHIMEKEEKKERKQTDQGFLG